LAGRKGRDGLLGLNGDDILIGGLGRDRMEGGFGDDTFLFRRMDLRGRPDVITDFEVGSDIIDLQRVFGVPRLTSDDPFEDFVRIKGNSNRTAVQINRRGDLEGVNFKTLVVLKDVDFNSIDVDSFIV